MEIGAPGILAQAPERQHSVEEVASLWTDSLTASAVCSLENKSFMSLSALEIALKFLNSQSNRQRCTGGELKRLPLCGQLTASAVCSLEKKNASHGVGRGWRRSESLPRAFGSKSWMGHDNATRGAGGTVNQPLFGSRRFGGASH